MNTTFTTKNAAMNTNMTPQRAGPLAFCLASRNAAIRVLRYALIACAMICPAPHVRASVVLIQDGFDGAAGDTNPTIYYIGAAAGSIVTPSATTPAVGSTGAITGQAYYQIGTSSNSGEVINFTAVTLLTGDSITLSFNYANKTVPTQGWLQFGFFNSMAAPVTGSGPAPDGTTTHVGYFVRKDAAASSNDCSIFATLGGAGSTGITVVNAATNATQLGATMTSGVAADALFSHSVNFTLALGSGNVLTETLIFDGTSYSRTSTPVTTTFNEFMWDPSSWGGYSTYVDNLLVTSVPEPATWALLAFSLTTVMVLRRRRVQG